MNDRTTRPAGSRGAHAAPRTTSWALPSLRTARPRHGRQSRAPLPAVVLSAAGGGLALLGLIGPPSPSDADSPPRASILANGQVAPAPLDPDRDERASRSRRAALPDPEPTPVPTSPVDVSVPVAPAPPLPGCDGKAYDLDSYRNGKLPLRVLCEIPGADERLRADAAVAFARLARAYEADRGEPLCLTDGYRPLAEQQQLRRSKRRLAARPGYSEHGWGLAVDLSCGVQSSRTAAHAWVAAHAGRYGWFLPEWAQRGGSRPEPWHWEFSGVGTS